CGEPVWRHTRTTFCSVVSPTSRPSPLPSDPCVAGPVRPLAPFPPRNVSGTASFGHDPATSCVLVSVRGTRWTMVSTIRRCFQAAAGPPDGLPQAPPVRTTDDDCPGSGGYRRGPGGGRDRGHRRRRGHQGAYTVADRL